MPDVEVESEINKNLDNDIDVSLGVKHDIGFLHKSNVYFEFFEPKLVKKELSPRFLNRLRQGDVYIYLNQLILNEDGRWFKVYINDICNINVNSESKQLILRVGWFDLVLFCEEDGQLSAIKNFIELVKHFDSDRSGSKTNLNSMVNGNKLYRKLKVKVPVNYHKLST